MPIKKPLVSTPTTAPAPVPEEFDDLEIERNAERAVEGLVDRFAGEAESSLLLAATRDPSKPASSESGVDIMPLGDKKSGVDREHWFDDDPVLKDSTVITGPKVTAWTPGMTSSAVKSPEIEQPASSRSDAEREMLKALRISGVRR